MTNDNLWSLSIPKPMRAPSVWQVPVTHFGIYVSTLALLTSSPTLNISSSWTSLPSATHSPYNSAISAIHSLVVSVCLHLLPLRHSPSPSLSDLLLLLTQPGPVRWPYSAYYFSTSALDSSRCPWLCSLSHIYKKNFPLDHTTEWPAMSSVCTGGRLEL